MRKILSKYIYLLLIIVATGAAFFRFYKLGSQRGMIQDEAAVGYNAYSILKTGKDEFGKTWPFFFRSFGEGKLPIYVYQAVIPIAIFGLNEFAVRFSSAFFGTLTVILIFFFTKEILEIVLANPKNNLQKIIKEYLSILSAFFLATMPWAIFFARGIYGQEALFWIVLGSLFSLRSIRLNLIRNWIYANLAFILALGSYHAAKTFVPLWILVLLIYFLIKTKDIKRFFINGVIALFISGFMWYLVTFSPLGMARAADMSITSPQNGISARIWETESESGGQPVLLTRALHNKVETYGRNILKNYFSHFNFDFLFFYGDPRISYRIPNMGQLLVITLPIIFIGLYLVIKLKLWPIIVFLAISPLAAALTYEVPSSVRAISLVIPLSMTAGLGTLYLLNLIRKLPKLLAVSTIFIFAFFYFLNFLYFLDSYFIHAKYHMDDPSQYGNKELMLDLKSRSSNYKTVKVTDKLSNPYIFYLFYNQYNPNKWHPQSELNIEKDANFSFIHIRKLDNIQFLDEACPDKGKPQVGVLYACLYGSEPAGIIPIKTYFDNNSKPYLVLFSQN